MKKLLLLVSLGTVFMFTGCKPQGCMDDTADNFDADAEKDDGSCDYTAEMVFYCDSARTRELVADNVNSVVDVYVNGEKVGSFNYYNYVKETPNCTDNFDNEPYQEVVNHTQVLVRGEEDSVDVEFKDSAGNVISDSYTLINAGDCKSYRI